MVSRRARVLFVHVQKAGGTTVDHIMAESFPDAERLPRLPRHVRLRGILRREPELRDCWTFGFVRNPWDRMFSWHAMIRRYEQQIAAGDTAVAAKVAANPLQRRVVADFPDLESFVLRGTEELPWLRWPQLSYLRAGTRTADFIGRQERFAEDMAAVLDRLGVAWPGSIPRENAAEERADYREAFTPAMRDRVARLFAPDLRAFGYEF